MCSINSLAAVLPYIGKDHVTSAIVPLIVKAMKDPVPNVRFCAAKVIIKYHSSFDSGSLNSHIVPVLKEMTSDSDKDVAYYANVGLNSI